MCQQGTKKMKGKCSSYNVPVTKTDNVVNVKVKTFKLSWLRISNDFIIDWHLQTFSVRTMMMQKRRKVDEEYMKTQKIGSFIVSKDKVQMKKIPIMYMSYKE